MHHRFSWKPDVGKKRFDLQLSQSGPQSLVSRPKGKLSPRYARPFKIVEKIGVVAYHLQLPEGARVHYVFHIGVLKPFHGTLPQSTPQLPPISHGRILQRQSVCLAPVFVVAPGTSWFSGMISLHPRPPGNPLRYFAMNIHHSSSRKSCLSMGGEMLCTYTRGRNTRPVAEKSDNGLMVYSSRDTTFSRGRAEAPQRLKFRIAVSLDCKSVVLFPICTEPCDCNR